MAKTTPFLFLAPEQPETDEPWWTLRFESPVPPQRRVEIQKLLAGIDGVVNPEQFVAAWNEGALQCSFDPGDVWFENDDEWSAFYDATRASFDAIHAIAPLTAVMFQTYDDLHSKSDDELKSISQSVKP
jgi:hypothetical protein